MYTIKLHRLPLRHAEKVGSLYMVVTMGPFRFCSCVVRLGSDAWNMVNAESPHGQVGNGMSFAAQQLILFPPKQSIAREESYGSQEGWRVCCCSCVCVPRQGTKGVPGEPELMT